MNLIFAVTEHGEAVAKEALPLGLDAKAFVIQLITFLFVFLLLKRFAFTPITNMLEKRRKTIDDGVRLGLRLEKERDKLDEEIAQVTRDARHEADKIVAAGHKDARELVREAEKNAQAKIERMIVDAEERIKEESEHAKRKLEKDLIGLVSEATEVIVGEKVDSAKDLELVQKAMKAQK